MQMLKLIGSFSEDSKETGYKQMHFRGKLASRLGDLPGAMAVGWKARRLCQNAARFEGLSVD
jgi:hypothetical protein